MAKKIITDVQENPLYHDTWKLLKKYRDVVWSLELSVQQVQKQFHIEYGKSIDDFLDSVYLAGADLAGTEIEHHAQCIQRSAQMIHLLDEAVACLRCKHKDGEELYWILFISYLSPHKPKNAMQAIQLLRPHIRDISYATYFRRRQYAIDTLSSVLWGYTTKDCLEILEKFIPNLKDDTKLIRN